VCSPHFDCLQDGLAERLPPGEIKTRIRDAPFVQIPLGVTEDRLVGTVDIEASMKVGWQRAGRSGVGRQPARLTLFCEASTKCQR
jgi:Mg-chelatase subunit ChlI